MTMTICVATEIAEGILLVGFFGALEELEDDGKDRDTDPMRRNTMHSEHQTAHEFSSTLTYVLYLF